MLKDIRKNGMLISKNDNTVVIGLSEEELERLKKGEEGLTILLTEIGFDYNLHLVGGKTEEKIAEKLGLNTCNEITEDQNFSEIVRGVLH